MSAPPSRANCSEPIPAISTSAAQRLASAEACAQARGDYRMESSVMSGGDSGDGGVLGMFAMYHF